ncbi:MAG TPA: GNAT family N-acetyltransferase [Oculatellaceae cyanobacterium]
MSRPAPDQLLTSRLRLRRWLERDLEPFAQMNACPEVMRHFPKMLSVEESNSFVGHMTREFEEENLGLWAVEILGSEQFIGFVGLHKPTFDAHFTPCVEVGWRLSKDFWGRGYATEAAQSAMADGYQRLGLQEIVSMTSIHNVNSMKVMERLGMTRNPDDDFLHPRIPVGDWLSQHVLYRQSPETASGRLPAI